MTEEQQQIFDDYLNERGGRSTEINFVGLFCGGANENSLKKRMRRDWDAVAREKTTKDLKPVLHKIHFLIN